MKRTGSKSFVGATLVATLLVTADAHATAVLCLKGRRVVARSSKCVGKEISIKLSAESVEAEPPPPPPQCGPLEALTWNGASYSCLPLSCEVIRAVVNVPAETTRGVYNFKTDSCPDGKQLTGGGFNIRSEPPDGFAFLGSKRVQDSEGQWQCVFFMPGNAAVSLECFAHCCGLSGSDQ